jgi:transitional endoplasmic reticulum ATPase
MKPAIAPDYLLMSSNFPNPSTAERRQYAMYWQHKLASNKDVSFPDSLLDEVAGKTAKFSFAYIKEAL